MAECTPAVTDEGTPYRHTVAALLDMSHRAADSDVWTPGTMQCDIPATPNSATCTHTDAMCPDCVRDWSDYTLLEPVPWNTPGTDVGGGWIVDNPLD